MREQSFQIGVTELREFRDELRPCKIPQGRSYAPYGHSTALFLQTGPRLKPLIYSQKRCGVSIDLQSGCYQESVSYLDGYDYKLKPSTVQGF